MSRRAHDCLYAHGFLLVIGGMSVLGVVGALSGHALAGACDLWFWIQQGNPAAWFVGIGLLVIVATLPRAIRRAWGTIRECREEGWHG